MKKFYLNIFISLFVFNNVYSQTDTVYINNTYDTCQTVYSYIPSQSIYGIRMNGSVVLNAGHKYHIGIIRFSFNKFLYLCKNFF